MKHRMLRCQGTKILGTVLACGLSFAVANGASAAAPLPAGSQESGCTLADCFLPESGRRYTYVVHYPDGDHGTMTMLPTYDEGSGILVCHNRAYSEFYQQSIDSRVHYQHLPDGIYRIESLGSGVPELWLPAELIQGMSWETGSGVHRLVDLNIPCPSKLLSGSSCMQVVSRYHVMQDIEVESYFAVGFGRILSRIRSSSSGIEFELVGFDAVPDSLDLSQEG